MHSESLVSEVVSRFKIGELDRRSAIKQLLARGLSAPAAYTAIGVMGAHELAAAQPSAPPTSSPSSANSFPATAEALQRNMEALSKLVSSPEMQAAIDQAQNVKEKRKAAQVVIDAAYQPGLRERVGLSDAELRTSMRVFELNAKTGSENVLAKTRRVGNEGVTKFTYPNQPMTPIISDNELLVDLKKKKVLLPGNTLPSPSPNMAAERKGVCVSYGKDLCVSGGIP